MMRSVVSCCLVLLVGCASTGQQTRGATPKAGELSKDERAAAISHYLTSIIYEQSGRIPEAIEELRKAVDINPSTDLVVKLLGAYYVNEDYENAAAMAERAIASEPDNVVLHIWVGRIYYQLNRFDEASAAFERAIQLNPGNALAYEALAQIDEETNDLVGAVDTYRRMIEITPDSAFLHYRLGMNLVEMNRSAEAMTELERALELNPQLTPARYMLGLLYIEADRNDAAIEQFEAFLRENPDHAQTEANVAAALAREGKYDEAIDRLTKIIEGPEAEPDFHVLRTFLVLQRGTSVPAGMIAAPGDAPIVGTVLQALVKRAIGEPHAALVQSIDAIEGDLDAECNQYVNRIISMFGDEAGEFFRQQLETLIQEDLRSRSIEIMLGRVLMSLEHHADAAALLTQTASRYPGDKWIYYYLATSYQELDRSGDSEAALRKSLEFDPTDPDVLNFLGYLLADENIKLAEAERLVLNALQVDPENGFYLDSLGWVYYRQGKAKLAIENIRRAIRAMNSDDAILRDHLGDAYLLDKDYASAVREWQRALRLDPEIEGVQEKIDRYQGRIKTK